MAAFGGSLNGEALHRRLACPLGDLLDPGHQALLQWGGQRRGYGADQRGVQRSGGDASDKGQATGTGVRVDFLEVLLHFTSVEDIRAGESPGDARHLGGDCDTGYRRHRSSYTRSSCGGQEPCRRRGSHTGQRSGSHGDRRVRGVLDDLLDRIGRIVASGLCVEQRRYLGRVQVPLSCVTFTTGLAELSHRIDPSSLADRLQEPVAHALGHVDATVPGVSGSAVVAHIAVFRGDQPRGKALTVLFTAPLSRKPLALYGRVTPHASGDST